MSDWVDFSYTGRIKTRPTDILQRDPDKQIPEAYAAFVSPLDSLEEVDRKIYETQSVYAAQGRELDRFGEYVGLERGVLGDDDYRQEILRVRFTQGGSGTAEDIYKLAQAITGFADVHIIEHAPATVMIHISGEKVPTDIPQVLDRAAMGGVRVYTTHDYGRGGFALAGVDRSQGEALKLAPDVAMRAGAENEIMGLNQGQGFIGGSRLAAASMVGSTTSGVLDVNGDMLETDGGQVIYVGTASYGDNYNQSRLCGAMPKKG